MTLPVALPLTPDACSRTADRRLCLELSPRSIEVLIRADESASDSHGGDGWLHAVIPLGVVTPGSSPVGVIEEAVYANPLLLADFKAISVLVETIPQWVCPAGFEPAPPAEDLRYLRGAANRESLEVSAPVNADVLKFLARSFNNPQLLPHLLLPIDFCLRLTRRRGRPTAYLQVVEGRADVIVADSHGLQHAASYPVSAPADCVYFTLAALESLGFDRLNGELLVKCTGDVRPALFEPLRRYVNSVMPWLLPSQLCPDASLELALALANS